MDWALIVEIITFVVFFYLLYRWLHAPLAKILRQRADRIEEDQHIAAERLRRAEQMQRETQQQVEQARIEAQRIIDAANKAAEMQRHALMEQARQDAESLARRAQDAIGRERQAAIAALRREAVITAVTAARQVLDHSLDANTNSTLADRTIADVGGRR